MNDCVPLPVAFLGLVLGIGGTALVMHVIYALENGELRMSKGWISAQQREELERSTR
jgi:hypothetical protein